MKHARIGLAALALVLGLVSCESIIKIKDPDTIAVTGVKLNKVSATLTVGESDQLVATVLPTDATTKTITWSTSNPDVVSVTGGLVTAVGSGDAVVKVTTVDGSKIAQAAYHINPAGVVSPYESITLDTTVGSVIVGESIKLVATVTLVPGATGSPDVSVDWVSLTPTLASVDSTGLVTGVVPGNAIIRAKTKDGLKTADAAITVNLPPVIDVSGDVKAGLDNLATGNITAARTAFVAAVAKNSNDNDAKIWSALLEVATLAVHPDVVDIFKTNLGVTDYPSDANTLISTNWMHSMVYNTTGGLAPSGAGQGSYVLGKFVGQTPGHNTGGTFYDAQYHYISAPNGSMFVPDPAGSVYAYDWYDYYSANTYVADYLSSNPGAAQLNGYVRGRVDPVPSGASATYTSYDPNTYTYLGWISGVFVPDENGTVYSSYWSISQNNSTYGSIYLSANPTVAGYQYSSSLIDLANPRVFPTIAPVAGFVNYNATPSNGHTMGDWMRLGVVNVLSRNPNGFNAVLDKVVTGPYGTSLDALITRLKSIPDGYRTLVPSNLYAFAVPPNQPMPATVSLGKAELLLFVSTLEVQKSLLQYLAAANWNYPISASLVDLYKDTGINFSADTNANQIPDVIEGLLESHPGLYSSTLLTDRSPASRAASKSTFLAALTDIDAALVLYKEAVSDAAAADIQSYYLPTFATVSGQPASKALRDQVTAGLNSARSALAALNAAITNNTTLYVPGTVNPNDLIGGSFVWPSDGSGPNTVAVNPGALWAENALDLRKWVETDANGFKYYVAPVQRYGFPPQFTVFPAPTDLTALSAASFGVNTAVTSGVNSMGLDAQIVLKTNLSMAKKFYPVTPIDTPFYAYVGPSWQLIQSSWNNGNGNYDYTYGPFTPNASSRYILGWINK